MKGAKLSSHCACLGKVRENIQGSRRRDIRAYTFYAREEAQTRGQMRCLPSGVGTRDSLGCLHECTAIVARGETGDPINWGDL